MKKWTDRFIESFKRFLSLNRRRLRRNISERQGKKKPKKDLLLLKR